MMPKIFLGVLLLLHFQIVSCQGPVPTPPPPAAITSPPAAASSPVSPTITPTVTVATTPIVTSTPLAESRWVCDPSGGVACYETLTRVAMLNSEEGWAGGLEGMLLHYTRRPGSPTPSWNYVQAPWPLTFQALFPLNPGEVWAILGEYNVVHYRDGAWQTFKMPAGPVLDLEMVSPGQGWAVGEGGAILHYTEAQDEWQKVSSPTSNLLFAIDMLTAQEGWAVGKAGTVLHYQNGQWSQGPASFARDKPPDLVDLEMISTNEGWAVGNGILHYTNQ